MKRRIIKSYSVLVVVAVCLILSSALWAGEEFQARLITGGGGHPAEQAMKIRISIENYTSREEVLQLMEIFDKSGFEPFVSTFRGMTKGIFHPIGARGMKVILHAAQSIQTDKGRKILLFTERQSWDANVSQRIDRRFPFMVIELNINNKGKGEGKIYEQAHIRLTPHGTIVMDSYNSPPLQLWGVQVVK